MYAEAGLLLPFFQGSPQEAWGFQHVLPHFPAEEEHLLCANLPRAAALSLGNLVQMSTISDYDLGGEGDLFKAPEPILGEPVLPVDPISAAVSMMSGGGSIISAETIKAADMSPIENEDLLNEALSECKRDLIAKSAITEVSQETSDAKVASIQAESGLGADKNILVTDGPLQKSVSAECLSSEESPHNRSVRPNFLDFQKLNLQTALSMRRAYSEGDIKTLGNNNSLFGNPNLVPCSMKLLPAIGDERMQKIFRYKKKRTKRNFGRKIKYACRKALADSQPRIRGRFARTDDRRGKLEEHQSVKLQK